MSGSPRERLIQDGNQSLARGAVDAGCQFYAGFPGPATAAIHDALVRELPRRGHVAIGTPDAASALDYCVGASARGAKAMTATSSVGWARMIDVVQYAIMTELPVVIAVVQQYGPSTGAEMGGAQGDVVLTGYSIASGYPLPVFAPSDAYECYEMATAAFYWAEHLRTPVIVLSDKEVALTTEDLDPGKFHAYPAVSRRLASDEPSSPGDGRHDVEAEEEVAPFWPVGGRRKATMRGLAEDRIGARDPEREKSLHVLQRLERKIALRQGEMALVRVEGDPKADTLLIGFGTTVRTAKEAAVLARREGRNVAVANPLSLFPVPYERLQEAAYHALRVVVVEENAAGQYRNIIEPLFSGKSVFGVTSHGRRIRPEQILEAIDESEWKVPYA